MLNNQIKFITHNQYDCIDTLLGNPSERWSADKTFFQILIFLQFQYAFRQNTRQLQFSFSERRRIYLCFLLYKIIFFLQKNVYNFINITISSSIHGCTLKWFFLRILLLKGFKFWTGQLKMYFPLKPCWMQFKNFFNLKIMSKPTLPASVLSHTERINK